MINSIALFLILFKPYSPTGLIELRNLYYQAFENKQSADKFLEVMENIEKPSAPVHQAYKGMAHLMQAKFSYSPYTKLSGFKKGKDLLNTAISKAPAELELRFLRFSVQTNAPRFLGYYSDIQSDKSVILKQWKNCPDTDLKSRIKKYMLKSSYCNKNEKSIFE